MKARSEVGLYLNELSWGLICEIPSSSLSNKYVHTLKGIATMLHNELLHGTKRVYMCNS